MIQMKKAAQIVMLLIISFAGYSQNNAIFKGSTADGWSSGGYMQSASSIFTGGNADGWSSGGYMQSHTSIFSGGTADGWASGGYIQSNTSIFSGGIGDGWASLDFTQSNLNIQTGGIGDGWASIDHTQSSTNIQTGGIGDGWASTYRPQGPLPVTFISFTAEKQGTYSLLKWKTSQEINSDHFEIERSADALHYEYLGTISAAGNSTVPVAYSFVDYKPLSGLNYYRIRQIDIDGLSKYTPTRVVSFDGLQRDMVKYYPNPTIDFINILFPASLQQEQVVVNIMNASGVVMNQFKLDNPGSSVFRIDMSRYAKGAYIIQVKSHTLNSADKIILQ